MKKNILYLLSLLLVTSNLRPSQPQYSLPTLTEIQKILTREGGKLQEALGELFETATDLISTEEGQEQPAEESEQLSTMTVAEFLGWLRELQRGAQQLAVAAKKVAKAAKESKEIVKEVKGETWQEGLSEEPADIEEDDVGILITHPEEDKISTTEEDDFTVIDLLEDARSSEEAESSPESSE